VDMQNSTTSMNKKADESIFSLNAAYTNTSNTSSNITQDIGSDIAGTDISGSNPEKEVSEIASMNPSSSQALPDIKKIFKYRRQLVL